MAIAFLSIVIFTFALGLLLLGGVTWWIERERRRYLGLVMMISGVVIAIGYAFLGSRFSIAAFGRLIITVDLPRLMQTAIVYTLGVLGGLGLAGGLFLWVSGRLVHPTPFARQLAWFVLITLLVALVISVIAARISG
ncbi:MAG: hypothetical protein JXB35_05885 [Anaerolineae bacterium]|nr:hypothetical protein [Anaerolineae bacterium]